ncbi:NADH-quinone oxidoreductase subunit L [Aeromonas caviae]|jgi:NADH-quinone oxidoreductase subunit L|uniref:NADH-quinone oxidoreductase subunit L n=1 Tax=Aeromonas caviae TaxID=648 RepID=A0AAE9PPV0_AERCA|nr:MULTISPECIES: NADH-quinone oxidoreductase subunit L [Aeromonas]MDU7310944.1 NADH-quinone oxidoreductase subunit L [Aeromonas sp.]AUV15251.1 NADH-quinone oxidoreductase subunit L [Aeromonas sp. ASNIH7]KMY40049.1 NADH:ubiquinone oxidoreductase subunit L [Aeromonas caviae]KOG94443.1 NADH:ubiquinone oxidoreductase subunit L [Aeromonas caviae]MBL0535738.1 NADH-quinone oxidoreductase subunit L [Aeromonas caviae]
MSLLYLTFLFPLLGWLLLAFSLGRLGERTSALIGVGSIGLSALTTLWVGIDFLNTMPEGGVYTQTLWQWMTVGEFQPAFRLSLDGLSLTMLGVVTGVGFFIHLFASWYMRGEEGYSRFFTYTNLFIASMLFLVLADDLLFVYLGWEGVGLCSYLLIGFYYKDRNNGAAALKAFVVTRVGDVFLAIGLFVLYRELGTLNIHELLVRSPAMFADGSPALSFACLMLLGGAVGKSAQLPLQTWLADAMAGPTPVSALIHAATMVTAGVYLIARTHGLFLLAPEILHLVALVGAITLVLAGFAALVQTDIKRILAYSTMSQIGYMFLALGVGAWEGAIFHLMTHAFFKALLFLSAGAVIIATHHEQNIFKMGDLRKSLPLVYACFLVGGSALAALPLVTAGFYSKDAILWQVQASGQSALLWAGLGGAFLTTLYTFRLIFIAFHGKEQTQAHAGQGLAHHLPLLVLLVLSTGVGALIVPPLAGVLPAGPGDHIEEGRHGLEILSGVIAVAGIALAAFLFLGERRLAKGIAESALGRALSTLWFNAWGFDWLYDLIWVKPYLLATRLLGKDPLDRMMNLPAVLAQGGHQLLAWTVSGKLRWYAASMGMGAALILALLLLG